MFERDAKARLVSLWADFPVVLVSGARQVGKTTLVSHLAGQLGIAQSLTLDHSGIRHRASEDPELFIQNLKLPAFLDEAQKSPALFEAVKQQIDNHRQPGQIMLSGSANFLLLKQVSESLAGRAARLFLRGLSIRELLGQTGKPPHLEKCLKIKSAKKIVEICRETCREVRWPASEWALRMIGGRFPELCTKNRKNEFRISWMESYVDAFVEKDLPDLGNVQNRLEFRRFWQIAASASAQLRDLSTLGSALGISYHTASRYLGLLEQGCHLFQLAPYFSNIGKRLTKAPRIFSEDTGLALFLSGIRNLEQLEASDRRGAWLENFVTAEIKSILEIFFPGSQLWFWRTLAGAEVDLLVEDGRSLLPIEIKWATQPRKEELKGLQNFLKDFEKQAPLGIVACGTNEPFLITERIAAVPLAWLLT